MRAYIRRDLSSVIGADSSFISNVENVHLQDTGNEKAFSRNNNSKFASFYHSVRKLVKAHF